MRENNFLKFSEARLGENLNITCSSVVWSTNMGILFLQKRKQELRKYCLGQSQWKLFSEFRERSTDGFRLFGGHWPPRPIMKFWMFSVKRHLAFCLYFSCHWLPQYGILSKWNIGNSGLSIPSCKSGLSCQDEGESVKFVKREARDAGAAARAKL